MTPPWFQPYLSFALGILQWVAATGDPFDLLLEFGDAFG